MIPGNLKLVLKPPTNLHTHAHIYYYYRTKNAIGHRHDKTKWKRPRRYDGRMINFN